MRRIALILVTVIMTGCGTIMRYAFDDDPTSCEMPPYVYGGTALDWSFLTGPGQGEGYEEADTVVRAIGLLDIPLSIVADTVMLPVSIPLQIKKAVETNCEQASNS